ncbi:6-bladed beta-propeller [Parabacteroides sp. AGMB00274]|uniref:6-bladed beta-propeller n=1 Tax=Parabacteroides faecalis TaxID=2924040 RepID=A0ABT0BY19_9BACT|nr:6-bladed beta-propeller [Parabacteroides faecalis]MCJ2379629.1 6-bladed beta-propeller [Parabacteroides faecalis]
MKTLIYIETILLLVMTSCGSDNASTDGFITVDVTKSSYSPKKELVLQDFMDVEYIPLETNDEFVNHGNVQAVGEKYIIVTNYRNDGDIFVYNRKGKAIRKINRKGQGAEEYTYCSGVTLDEDNNEMFIDDHFIKKVFVYDLEGNFKRSFKQKNDGGSRSYDDIFNFDKENLICYDELNNEIPFLLVSKQDGNITKEIKVPFKEKKLFFQILRQKEGTRAAGPGLYSRIIPYNNNWILIEPSSDTIYTLMPDCSLRPFIAKTPPVHTMNPEFYQILRLISDRYYFMESVKNVYDFRKREGFPRTYFMYDTQEKDFFSYIIYNGDYSYKKELYMIMFIPINAKGELWATIDAFELCRDYEKGKLKGKLKDIAAKLGEDDNRVIMLVKPKK